MKRSLRAVRPLAVLVLLLSLSSTTTAAVQVTPLPPVETTDGRAGTCFSYYPGDPDRPYLPLMRDAGSRWDRFDFIWPNIEHSKSSWHFEAYDDLVQDMSDAEMNTIGILLWTPDWAATASQQAQSDLQPMERPTDWYASSLLSPQAPPGMSSSPPQGLYEPWDDWKTSNQEPINYWGRYVHTVVSRYSDPNRFPRPVKYWEIWNEVDDGDWNYFWTGSEADYARLLKVGYQATKDACPDCTVLYAGLLYWADQHYFERVLDILNDDPNAPANNYYFDAMSLHLYSRSSTTYDIVNHVQSRVKKYTSEHPVWLTETGVPVWGDESVDDYRDKYDFAATQEEAAAYVIQSYANALASDAKRYLFFRANDEYMVDSGGRREYFGLVRNDQSLRPSYVAYQVATSHMVSPTMVTNWTYTQGVRRVTLWGTPHGKISVLWNTKPYQITFDYDATLSTATLMDQRGSTRSIAPTTDAYEITLPGATAHLEPEKPEDPLDYFIGGEPYLIIENDTIPPSGVTIDPLPTTTYSHTVPIAWSASDDHAGVWGVEIEVQRDGVGSWSDWLGLRDTQGTRSASYGAGQHGSVYCFRARAWDRAGNLGLWSDGTDCTQIDLTQHQASSYLPLVTHGE